MCKFQKKSATTGIPTILWLLHTLKKVEIGSFIKARKTQLSIIEHS
jgi:hypothetical protein